MPPAAAARTRSTRAPLSLAVLFALTSPAAAQVGELDTSHAIFYEAPTRTHMFVYSPTVAIQASPWSWLDVRAGWEADVVSGASVATKFGSSGRRADVVSAASVHDFRNVGRGEFTVRWDSTAVTAGYAYSTEHDYRSNSLHVSASTDTHQHNTQFAISYARNFDEICDRVQTESDPTRWVALESSVGCFAHDLARVLRPVNIDAFEASWAQSWSPTVETQWTYSAQLVDGFQGDPYRSVVLGEGVKAQEHEPNERARQAITGRIAWYLRPLRAALRVSLRGYYDTWAIKSGTLETELERSFGENVRLLVRGRLYDQSGALFWTDDYTGGAPPLGPRGQYWTGDRELSPFWSWLGGVRAVWTLAPMGRPILGVLESVKLAGSASVRGFAYLEYTLGGTPVSNARAYLGTASLEARF